MLSSCSRRLAGALLGAAMLVPAAGATAHEVVTSDPIRVLVFSEAYAFRHDSIVPGAQWLDALDGEEFLVDNTIDPGDLALANLERYDVVVWNNSTGEVPLTAEGRADLLGWVRDGHGFVGIHSAGDANYTWPEYAELIGGHYHGHWYRFGGITPEPTRLRMIQEDPDNPLMAGVPADYTSFDETYKWQVDVRPDVHVLLSMDNTSIAQGAVYDWHQPLTWCRPLGRGRTWYTNLGHDPALWTDDAVFQGMVLNALRYGGDRLSADCSVPADPATGVAGADRMDAVWADEVLRAESQVSSYSGGAAVLTRIRPGEATITWRDVDLTGVTSVDVFATAQTITSPSTVAVFGSPVQQRIAPASGGTVELRVDSATGPVLGTVQIPPAPGVAGATTVPGQVAVAQQTAGPAASWSLLTSAIVPPAGVHDLVLTFPGGPLNTALAAAAPERNFVGSIDWIRLGH